MTGSTSRAPCSRCTRHRHGSGCARRAAERASTILASGECELARAFDQMTDAELVEQRGSPIERLVTGPRVTLVQAPADQGQTARCIERALQALPDGVGAAQ